MTAIKNKLKTFSNLISKVKITNKYDWEFRLELIVKKQISELNEVNYLFDYDFDEKDKTTLEEMFNDFNEFLFTTMRYYPYLLELENFELMMSMEELIKMIIEERCMYMESQFTLTDMSHDELKEHLLEMKNEAHKDVFEIFSKLNERDRSETNNAEEE